VGERNAPGAPPTPLLWADPRLTILAPFWMRLLGIPATVVHVHRGPGHQAAALVAESDLDVERAFEVWDEVNRAALALWEQQSGLVLAIEAVEDDPETAVDELVALLGTCGVHPTADERAAATKVLAGAPRLARSGSPDVPNRFAVLHGVLSLAGRTDDFDTDAAVRRLSAFYDEDYYEHYGSEGGVPYRPGAPEWESFFASIAEHIVDDLRPSTALDAGCAVGFLVAALHDRGVEAHGVDVSEWAVAQAPERVRSRVRVGSLTDELEGTYDLITCIEVVEHLPQAAADRVIGNLTRHARAVLFSSTPDGFDEATHLNVRPPAYWSTLFAAHGFVRAPDFDASYLSYEAVLYVPGDTGVDAVLTRYEEALRRTTVRLNAQVADGRRQLDEQRERIAAIERSYAYQTGELERVSGLLVGQERTHHADMLGLRKELLAARRDAAERAAELAAARDELASAGGELEVLRRTFTVRLRAALGRLVRRAR